MIDKDIEQLIGKMKDLARSKDWEATHSIYDEIMESKLRQLDRNFVKRMKRLSKGYTFWCA